MTNGKDRIIFYDSKKNEIIYELEGHSFCMSKNSLLLMKNNKTLNDQILLCACKKYNSYQKNGILLIYIIFGSRDFDEKFYDIEDFEPTCLSHISLVNDSSENQKSGKIYKTNYFFIGGFDPIKGVGAIKLYKLILNYDPSKIKIEFCQDVIFEDEDKFYGFNGNITSIVQSNDTGKFLISCSDGNIYLFSPANINYYLFYDEEMQKDLEYEEIPFFDESIQKEIDDGKEIKIDNKEFFRMLLNSMKKDLNFDINFLI